MLRNVKAVAEAVVFEPTMSEGLRDMARDMERRFINQQGYTDEESVALLKRMRSMANEAARLEGKPEPDHFVNADAAKAAAILHKAGQMLALQHRALVERVEMRRTDPSGRIRVGLQEAIAEIEAAGAIVAGVEEARS